MATDYSKFRASKEEVEAFYTKPFDMDGAREKMVARIERTMKQLNGDKVSPRGGKDFETLEGNGVVYRPTLNGQPLHFLDTDEEDGFHATRDNLKAMLPELIKDVNAGALDDLLKEALTAQDGSEGSTATSGTSSASTGNRKPRQGSASKEGKFPKGKHPDYDKLTSQQKRNLGRWWSLGRNPDQSLRSEVGDKPEALYTDPNA